MTRRKKNIAVGQTWYVRSDWGSLPVVHGDQGRFKSWVFHIVAQVPDTDRWAWGAYSGDGPFWIAVKRYLPPLDATVFDAYGKAEVSELGWYLYKRKY